MRAAYIEKPGTPANLVVGDLPEPHAGPGEVRVMVRAAGIGPWDVKAMAGAFGEISSPYVVGFEFAGVIDEVGEGVSDLAIDDAIYGTDWKAGSLAEYRVVAAESAARKPAAFEFVESVALAVGGTTALEGLVERLGLGRGETVLVTGASGGVGTIAVQVARDAGARVFGLASRRHHDYLRDLGAEAAFDYRDAGWAGQVREASGGGVDALFDGVGGDTLAAAFEAVREGGRALGIVYGGPDSGPRGIRFERFSAASGAARLRTLAGMADAGRLRVELAAELPLDHAREALERVADGHTRGKVVVTL